MKNIILLYILVFSIGNILHAQEEKFCYGGRIIFYNTEQLFDTEDDAGSADRDYLKGGKLNWDEEKYSEKIAHLGRVLAEVADTANPLLIGLTEIENRRTLEDLIGSAALKPYKFKYIHHERSGNSGTEPALLYRPEYFVPEYDLRLADQETNTSVTESGEVLYVKGYFNETLAVYLFVNQWPEGEGVKTKAGRASIAGLLGSKIEDIRKGSPYARFIVMGDFNENPDAALLKDSLKLRKANEGRQEELINVMPSGPNENNFSGKVKGLPVLYDQIMLSRNLMETKNKWGIIDKGASVFKASWLLDTSGAPLSTYKGKEYRSGYSDRLPVWADLYFRP
jgi:hypothetical protein